MMNIFYDVNITGNLFLSVLYFLIQTYYSNKGRYTVYVYNESCSKLVGKPTRVR